MSENKEWKKIEKNLEDLNKRRNESFKPVHPAAILAVLAVFAVCFLAAVKILFFLASLF